MPVKSKSKPKAIKAKAKMGEKFGWGYSWNELQAQLNRIEAKQRSMSTQISTISAQLSAQSAAMLPIVSQEKKLMATLQDILADVQQEKSDIDSIVTLISGLKEQITTITANAGISPDVQAQIDAVFAAVETNKQAVHDAVTANTTPTPQPT